MKRFLKGFFSFSRKEQLGILVLICLIIIVLVLRSLLPGWRNRSETDFSEYQEQIDRFEESISGSNDDQQVDPPSSLPGQHSEADDTEVPESPSSLPGQLSESDDTEVPESPSSRVDPPSSRAVLININSADSVGLRQIRGIGPVLSKRIVKYRYLLGGFVSSEQLKEVYGIDEERYEQIEKQFYTDSSGIRYIDLNKADQYALSRHPYLSESQAGAIITYRKSRGDIDRPELLLDEKILDEEVYRKIRPYLLSR